MLTIRIPRFLSDDHQNYHSVRVSRSDADCLLASLTIRVPRKQR